MKNYGTEIKWAIVFFAATLLWMVFEKVMGWHDELIADHATFSNFFALIAIAIYVMAMLDKRDKFYEGTMSWKQGFISGLIMTLIITILSPLSQYITSTVITPEYFPNVIMYAVTSGKMSMPEAENYFNLKSYILQGLVGALVMGLLTSMLVALVVKRKEENK